MSLAPAAVGLFPSYVMAIIRRPRLQVLPLAPASVAGSRTRTALCATAPAGGWRKCCHLTTLQNLGEVVNSRPTGGPATLTKRLYYANLLGESSICGLISACAANAL